MIGVVVDDARAFLLGQELRGPPDEAPRPGAGRISRPLSDEARARHALKGGRRLNEIR